MTLPFMSKYLSQKHDFQASANILQNILLVAAAGLRCVLRSYWVLLVSPTRTPTFSTSPLKSCFPFFSLPPLLCFLSSHLFLSHLSLLSLLFPLFSFPSVSSLLSTLASLCYSPVPSSPPFPFFLSWHQGTGNFGKFAHQEYTNTGFEYFL